MTSGLAFGAGRSDEYEGMRDLGDRVRKFSSAGVGVELRIPEDVLDLGLAMLVAEAEDGGGYEPVGVVGSIGEASAVAVADLLQRMTSLEQGGDPLCPSQYVLWTRRTNGYAILAVMNPLDPSGGWSR